MAGERSHGKARPRLPRASDLKHKPAGPNTGAPRHNTGPDGRFVVGNAAAIGTGKAPIRRALGRSAKVTDTEARLVARDAETLFGQVMAELPSDGAMVRQLAALWARHAALAAFWTARASKAGLGTEAGLGATGEATKHGQRAERLSISMLDVARDMARDAAAGVDPIDAVNARIDAQAAALLGPKDDDRKDEPE